MPRFLVLLLLFASPLQLRAGDRIFYLSSHPGYGAGRGTIADPIDVSTSEKLDRFFARRFSEDRDAKNNRTEFHFLAGNYSTQTGIRPASGWELIGADPDQTTITFTAKTNVGNTSYGSAIIATNDDLHDVTVRDLTLDGGALATGAPVSARFQTPPRGRSVTVRVADTRLFKKGARVYVQDTAMADGVRTFYGEFKITGLRRGSVTLLNDGQGSTAGSGVLAPVGATVPTSARIFLLLYARAGIVLASRDIYIENVTVQDVSIPAYEGPIGFDIFETANEIGSGDLIDRCTLRNVYGCYGWGIGVVQNNPYPSRKYYGQCDITNCVLDGNGYYQGIDFIEVENSTVAHNLIRNFYNPFFSDSGICAHVRFTDNTFIGPTGPAGNGSSEFELAGSFPWIDCLFADNTLVSREPGGHGIYILSPLDDFVFRHNRLEGIGNSSVDFLGPGKNVRFLDNIIDPRLAGHTVKSPSLGIEQGNVTPSGKPVTLGFGK